jgi:octaprenyl-diphosphate synthase
VNIEFITGPVEEYLRVFESAFADILHSRIPLAEQVVRYVAGLKGKRLRPLLVFLTAELHGPSGEKTMQSALVVELLHTATLVHDDVVDNSNLRRGASTVNDLWDNRISVLIGDLLFARTLSCMVRLKDDNAMDVLAETTDRITEGELLQIEKAGDATMDEAIYMDWIGKKTASLLSASCALGALSVPAGAGQYEKMKSFGENLGIAFQIKDDLLDFTGDTSKLGKPVGNDLQEHKITLPLIHALQNAEETERSQVLQRLDQNVLDEQTIQRIVGFVKEKGGLTYADTVARRYAGNAAAILAQYPESAVNTMLKKLVDFAITREN